MAITGICNLQGQLPARIQNLNIKRFDCILLLAIGALIATGSIHMIHVQQDISAPELHMLGFQALDVGQASSLNNDRIQGNPNIQRPVFGFMPVKPITIAVEEPFDYNSMGCNLLGAILRTVTGVIFEDYIGNGLSQSPKPNHAPVGISCEKIRAAAGYSYLAGR